MFSVSRQFAPHALQYCAVWCFRKESAHLVIRKYLSTSDSTITQDHEANINKSRVLPNELTQWTDAFNLIETNNITVSVLRNHQTKAYDHLGQIYEEYSHDLEEEIIQLMQTLKKRDKTIRRLKSMRKSPLYTSKSLEYWLYYHEKFMNNMQKTARTFRIGRIRNVRSALEYVRRRVRQEFLCVI